MVGNHGVEVSHDVGKTWRFAFSVGVLEMSYFDKTQRDFMVECTQKTMLFLVEGHIDICSLEDHEERVGTVEVDMERRDKDGDVSCLVVVDRWVGKMDRGSESSEERRNVMGTRDVSQDCEDCW